MAKPDRPADLKHCADCDKLVGTPETKGWFGPECQCRSRPANNPPLTHTAGQTRKG